MQNKRELFTNLSTFHTFVAGAVAGILVMCTVGFFILAAMYFGDDNLSVAATNQDTEIKSGLADDGVVISPEIDPVRDYIRGNQDADITLIEFSDIECPYCKKFHETSKLLYENYSDEVRFVYRHFPIDALHANSRAEAIATECAAEQGKFWEMLDSLFESTESNDGFDLETLPTLARTLGLNVADFEDCLDQERYKDKVAEDEQSAITAGAAGTPFSVLLTADGRTKVISGAQSYEAVVAAVEEMKQ